MFGELAAVYFGEYLLRLFTPTYLEIISKEHPGLNQNLTLMIPSDGIVKIPEDLIPLQLPSIELNFNEVTEPRCLTAYCHADEINDISKYKIIEFPNPIISLQKTYEILKENFESGIITRPLHEDIDLEKSAEEFHKKIVELINSNPFMKKRVEICFTKQ